MDPDPREVDLIRRLIPADSELRELWEEHQRLEAELARLDARKALTPQETLRRKEIQKSKLAGKDRIQVILDRHR